MRQASNSNGRRLRGRMNRGKGGNPGRVQVFESNGPAGRVRGNAFQLYEKYVSLARDASSGGDRIATESLFQYAEHYFRVMNDGNDPSQRGAPRESRHTGNGAYGRDSEHQGGAHQGGGGGRSYEAPGASESRSPETRSPDSRTGDQRGERVRGDDAVQPVQKDEATERDDEGPQKRGDLFDRGAEAEAQQPAASGEASEQQTPSRRKPGRPAGRRPAQQQAQEAEAGEEKPAPRKRGRPRKSEKSGSEPVTTGE